MIDNNSTDGSVIAFTDSDCALEQGWLRSITAGMNNSKVGVQLGQTMPANNSKLFVLFETYQHYLREYIFNSKIQELYFGYTNNMTVRSSLLDKEMPFIEKQRGADSIIVSQLVDKHSCDIVKYCPEMRVRHLEITGMAEEYRRMFIYIQSGISHSYITHRRPTTMRERLHIFRRTCGAERLSLPQSIVPLILLIAGLTSSKMERLRIVP